MINLEQLACLSDKDIKRYTGRDDSKVRLGEYYVGKPNIGLDEALFKVVYITKHTIVTASSTGEVNTWNYDSFRHTFTKLTEKSIVSHVTNKRKELFSKIFPKTLIPYSKIVEKILSNILPESQYEVKLDSDSVLYIIIHLPEFVISNSAELSHTIKDFYIRTGLYKDSGAIRLIRPAYARTTYNISEVQSSYKHSHTNAELFTSGFRDEFCYGRTEMSSFLNRIHNKSFDVRQFSTFIVNLLDFLQWESLEGTPYRYISNIGTSRGNPIYSNVVYLDKSVIEHGADRTLAIISDKLVLDSLFYEVIDDKITLSDNSKTYIDSLCTLFAESSVLFELDSMRRSISSSNLSNNYIMYNNSPAGFKFKGEDVRFKIEGIGENQERDNRRIHRDILKKIFSTIEMFIESELIKDYYDEYVTI